MRNSLSVFSCGVLIFSLMGGTALPQAYRNPPQAPAAAAMGNAFVAGADDPSAVFYNPAALTELDGHQIMGGIQFLDSKVENTTQGMTTQDKMHFLPFGFGSSDLWTERFRFGGGVFSEYGLSTKWPRESEAAYIAEFSKLKTVDYRGVLAYKLAPWLSLGGGLDIVDAELKTESYVDWDAVLGGAGPSGGDGRFKFRGSDQAVGWNLGALIKPHKRHSFGFSFSSQKNLEFRGTSRLTNIPIVPIPGFPTVTGTESRAKANWILPATFTFGYCVRPTDRLKMEVDFQWVRFESLNRLNLRSQNPLIPDTVVPLNFKNVWNTYVGAEYELIKNLKLRGGWAHIKSPIRGQYWNGAIPDSNKNVGSMGIGYTWKNFTIDATYAAIVYRPRKIRNNVGAPFHSVDGHYKGFGNNVFLAMTVRF